MAHDVLSPISADQVPGYSLLNNFEWIPDFWKAEEIKKELQDLRVQKKELRNICSTKDDFIKRLKTSYDSYQARRVSWLARYLKNVERSNDPLARLELSTNIEYFKFLSFDEILQALEQLEFELDTGISDQEREERLQQIMEGKTRLEAELQAVSDPKYFNFNNASIRGDIRVLFCRHWLSIQGRCDAPCGPCGLTLDQSPDLEKKAYEQLKIAKAINHGSRLRPYVAR